MGAKKLIVVDSELLLGSVVARSVVSGQSAHPSRGTQLEMRRHALTELGDALFGIAHGSLPFSPNAAAVALNEHVAHPPQPGPRPFDVLAALGTLIVDEDDVDTDSLHGVRGVKWFDNDPLFAPEVTQALPSLPSHWHLERTGAHRAQGTGAGILVGVLDTGIDSTHPEFHGKMIHFREFDGFGRRLSNGARDTSDHGTHVSALVAGLGCGVAPDADLAVAAVLTNPSPHGHYGTTVQIATGLDWLLSEQFRPGREGVDILNASLGGVGYNPYLERVLRMVFGPPDGTLLVGAIGNSGPRGTGSPGNYQVTLGVGAVDHDDQVAEFSSWGTFGGGHLGYSKPDMSAPGVAVRSAIPGAGYAFLNGTSMASPIVCGAGARLLELRPELIGDPAGLKAALLALATGPVKKHPCGNEGGLGSLRLT